MALRHTGSLALLLFVALVNFTSAQSPMSLPVVAPAELGFDTDKLIAIDGIVAKGIEDKKMPGCVVAFGRKNKLAWLKAYGNKRVEWEGEPAAAMTVDTVFDLASLTKPIATATSVMHFFQKNPRDIQKTVGSFLPEFNETGDEKMNEQKRKLTVENLLTHCTGLIADNPIGDYQQGVDESRRRLLALKLTNEKKFLYSDVNFLVLGLLLEKVSGQNVHEYSQQHIFKPLGMQETTYIPGDELKKRCAPTERRDGNWMQGEVHDPRAYKLNGIAGHAGLFSTASDLSRYAAAMLNEGEYEGQRFLNDSAWKMMTTPIALPGVRNDGSAYEAWRAQGWDSNTGFSTNGGKGRSKKAFGHGGFTGTVIWIDPEQDWFFIFLSNRVHPNGKGLVNPLAGEIATVISAAATRK
ncbi:serine hydrolase domain-containing protein [Anatilimnocola floriformis]|uniref:serine hydrolase domain-containing protein n=1 Tax=Anatilimnocola floriformis TaxID=2948575 RepID=UPI0020C261DE|nr:serine hydrolase [Anatilimnocola floriformis]